MDFAAAANLAVPALATVIDRRAESVRPGPDL